jgi:hypothetical protein
VRASSPAETGTPLNEAPKTFQRRYKATAYVSFLSVPLFSFSGVGFGFAGTDEHANAADQKLSLRFLSGSTPERAHGLNRFGFIQENIQQKDRATISSDYFGLMTANKEESLADAKAALDVKTGAQVPFIAARAFIDQEKTSYSVRHMLLPSSYRGSNADQLLEQVQAEFALPQKGQIEKTELLNGQATGTFLGSLRQAILSTAQTYRSRIVFNGKTFQFQADKRPDLKTGGDLRKLGLTSSPATITLLNGTLRNEKTNEVTNFRLWFQQGSANFLPLRFEYKAKSYLRLVFDEELPSAVENIAQARELPQ